jgi:hypothetical protein
MHVICRLTGFIDRPKSEMLEFVLPVHLRDFCARQEEGSS